MNANIVWWNERDEAKGRTHVVDGADLLLNALNSLVRLHEELVSCAEEQRKALLSGDNAKLEQLLARTTAIVEKVEKAEAERFRATQALVKALELEVADITATDLAHHLDPLLANRLLQSVDRLREVITDLSARNHRNQLLTEQAVQFTAKTLQAVAGVVKNETYGPKRKVERAVGIFDIKA